MGEARMTPGHRSEQRVNNGTIHKDERQKSSFGGKAKKYSFGHLEFELFPHLWIGKKSDDSGSH